jgi:hypothetical protein
VNEWATLWFKAFDLSHDVIMIMREIGFKTVKNQIHDLCLKFFALTVD